MDTSLFEKQSNRFFQNIIDNIPIVVIAVQEGADPSSVRESIERAKKTLSKKYKKFIKITKKQKLIIKKHIFLKNRKDF